MNHRLRNTLIALSAAATLLLFVTPVFAQSDGEAISAGITTTYLLCCGLSLLLNLVMLVWVAKDASERGTSAGAWLIIVFLFGFLGLLGYLVARPQGKLVECPHCGRKKPIRDQICPHCGRRVEL